MTKMKNETNKETPKEAAAKEGAAATKPPISMYESAVESACENAALNNINNAEFICADLGADISIDPGKYSLVIVDPPRKGLDKAVLERLITARPDRIIYISCDPATLSRDVKHLSLNSYKAVEIRAVDMFPRTKHVEAIVRLERI